MSEDKTQDSRDATADNNSDAKQNDPWINGRTQSDTDTGKAEGSSSRNGEKETPDLSKEDWEKDLVNRLAFSAINEQRRSRRWSIFFKSSFLLYLIILLIIYIPNKTGELHIGPHTALVELSGPIGDNTNANANTVITGLRNAFKDENTRAVILRINSPGGSPVQAGYIYDEIMRLRKKYPKIPLYAVAADTCASAAYYIASAADKIYADKASIVGSIGVLMDGWGFVDAMNKLGIERRLLTSGENKAFLDPFSPMKEKNKKFMQGLLDEVHQQFINSVKKGRGSRLNVNYPGVFSGLFWTGEQSLKIGLVDGLGSVGYVAREVVKQENIVDFTSRPDYFQRFANRIGVAMANSLWSDVIGQVNLR